MGTRLDLDLTGCSKAVPESHVLGQSFPGQYGLKETTQTLKTSKYWAGFAGWPGLPPPSPAQPKETHQWAQPNEPDPAQWIALASPTKARPIARLGLVVSGVKTGALFSWLCFIQTPQWYTPYRDVEKEPCFGRNCSLYSDGVAGPLED